ncbi:MAG TPA: hypothetical protein VHI51_09150 [Ktedonobacterales bacterium]|nr:hypothetical protein [Ktedonobacterales bacterium]
MTTPATTTVGNTADKPPTYAQRATAAAAAAAGRFTFSDEKRMQAALTEIALEELERNPSFAVRVRNRYEELAPVKAARAPKAAKAAKPKLVPIKELPGFQLDATRRLDPWFILEYFGETQLETALRMQTIGNLREAIAVVEERYPGTAPKGKATKDGAISYILEYVLR